MKLSRAEITKVHLHVKTQTNNVPVCVLILVALFPSV